jgi:hypothetical protein
MAENDMLANAAAALFGAGLGAPEHVRPFMAVFLDDDEQLGQDMPSFKPAGRVLARLSWPPLRPYVARRGAMQSRP